jgi:Tfp pilus assembly protein PilV
MRWIAGLWARWRTRKARQLAEYDAMYQATVNALAAGMQMDAATRSKPAKVLDWPGYSTNGFRYARIDVGDKPKVH